MIRLIEGVKTGGYMLSKYGKSIPVKYHPYGTYEKDKLSAIEDNVMCAYFLYLNEPKLKNDMLKIIYNYICYTVDRYADNLSYEDLNAIGEDYKNIIYDIFYEYDCNAVINDWNIDNKNVNDFLFSLIKDKTISDLLDDLDYDNNGIEAYYILNQLYTRYRIGGEYDDTNENEIYFRISSTGYDWGEDIVDLVFNKYRDIQFITIERDKESCKLNGKDYKIYTLNGVHINHYSVKDFIFTEKPPILSAVNRMRMRKIPMKTIVEDFSRMVNNKNAIFDYLDRMNDIENRFVNRCQYNYYK